MMGRTITSTQGADWALVIEPISPGDTVINLWIADRDAGDSHSVFLNRDKLLELIADLAGRVQALDHARPER